FVQVQAHDNVFVDQIEISAGPTPDQLQTVHLRGGFPFENAVPGSSFDVYSPLVEFNTPVPLLANLGAVEHGAWFIGVRARDVNGNWSARSVQPVTVTRDLEPTVAILSPADGSLVVGGAPLFVTLLADDDV